MVDVLVALCGLAFADPARATAVTLEGQEQQGVVSALEADTIRLDTEAESLSLPIDTLQELRWDRALAEPPPIGVELSDGSTVNAASLVSEETALSIARRDDQPPWLVPRDAIRSIRFAPLEPSFADTWEELTGRETRDDLLVIRKGDVLDYVGGVVGEISPESVAVVVRGRSVAAPRARVFGIVYADRPAPKGRGVATVETVTQDRLQITGFELVADQLQLAARVGIDVTLPLSEIRRIDFSGSRIRYLADLPFDAEDSQPPHPLFPPPAYVVANRPAWFRGPSAPALQVGDEEYRKGLWLHSGAVVHFALNRQYTRLQAMVGIEQSHRERLSANAPHVRLQIEADGRKVFDAEFLWDTPPVELDVDVQDVRELRIDVESLGDNFGVLEHLVLGNARLFQ